MKYLNVKINLKNITGEDFHQLMVKYHHVPSFDHPHINHFDQGWMIHIYQRFNHVYAYHINDHVVYNYVFNENDCSVCISIDKNNDDDYIDLLQYFIENDYIDDYDDLYVSTHPFYIDHFDQYKKMNNDLPIVFVDESFNEEQRNHLAQLIKGMAVVIYGDDELNKQFKKYYQIRYNNYILLYNQEHYSIKPIKNETKYQLIDRIVSRVRTYSSKRIFSGTYNIHYLYEDQLQKMISEAKEYQVHFDNELTSNEEVLNKQIEDLKKKNQDLYVEMDKLLNKIAAAQLRIDALDKKPLLLYGHEKDLYPDEITDMIKFLLEEEIRLNRADKDDILMIKDIIKDNTTSNQRNIHLTQLKSLLWDNEVNELILSRLSDCGFENPDKNDHYKYVFYGDARYKATQSSSSSDKNGGRALYRDIKKYIF